MNPADKAVIDDMIEHAVNRDTAARGKVNALTGKRYCVNKSSMIERLRFIYYYTYDYICGNSYFTGHKSFVNVNQEQMKKYLKTNSMGVLKKLVAAGILECDYKSERNKKSFGYMITKDEYQLYSFSSQLFSKRIKYIGELKVKKMKTDKLYNYYKVLRNIKIDESKVDGIKKNVMKNKYAEQLAGERFQKIMRLLNLKYLIQYYSIRVTIVPTRNTTFTYDITNNTIPFYDAQTVPQKYLHSSVVNEHSNVARRDMRHGTIPWLAAFKIDHNVQTVEDDDTTHARLDKAIAHINSGDIYVNRPRGKSRVYSNVTNLDREFKDHLLLDGKHLIGTDLRNSQPLIASVLFTRYWQSIDPDRLPPDVVEYQRLCETGEFYDYFMEKNNIPNDKKLRAEFKAEFFRRVFFSMHIEEPNVLKGQFIEKYPSCWEVVCHIKGGYYCKDYGDFSVLLQETEAEIFYDHVNVKLIEQGVLAFNIYDSVYVTNEEDYRLATGLIAARFAELGITPTLEPEYYPKQQQTFT